MVSRPYGTNAFEFVVVSALRAAQLMKGCTPRVPAGYKHIVTAQLEVAAGKVSKIVEEPKPAARLVGSRPAQSWSTTLNRDVLIARPAGPSSTKPSRVNFCRTSLMRSGVVPTIFASAAGESVGRTLSGLSLVP